MVGNQEIIISEKFYDTENFEFKEKNREIIKVYKLVSNKEEILFEKDIELNIFL